MKTVYIYFTLVLSLFIYVTASCDYTSVNSNISIEDGEKVYHDLRSVNGGIYVGDNCQVEGSCQTVNGGIKIGKNSIVEGVQTVNGSIKVYQKVKIEENISSVNGSINIDNGTIEGDIETINGIINLSNTKIRRDIETVNGNIILDNGSHVKGDIVIKRKSGNKFHVLKIELLKNSIVDGNIYVEEDDRRVTVYLEKGSKVLGEIINAEIIEK